MSTFKRVGSQWLCLFAVAFGVTACGGGGSEDNTISPSSEAVKLPPSPTFIPAPLTTTNEIVKAAAAIVVANTSFESTVDIHYSILTAFAPTDNSTKELICGEQLFTTDKIPMYKITTNNHSPYTSYRTIESDRCTGLLGDYKFNTGGGKLIYACNGSDCLATITGLRYDRLAPESIYQTANGAWASKDNVSIFKGNVKISSNGLSSTFYFNNGLVQNPPNDGFASMGKNSFGKIGVSSGGALNCIDGEIDYNIIEPLTTFKRVNGGSIKITSNNIGGLVTFKPDGGLIIKKDGFAEETVSQSIFESFCALKQINEFSK